MFGAPKKLTVSWVAWFALWFVLAFLLLQVGVIAYVSLALAQQWKTAISQPLPVDGITEWFKWLAALVPAMELASDWRSNLLHFLFWSLLIAEALFVRYFIIEFVGDVAAYISPYKESKFDELRRQIRKIGLNVGKIVYGFGPKVATVPEYDKVVLVGHSLGSVLAYDTLNALINVDNVCTSTKRRNVVQRTRALITFGSPLDKTAFIFRIQARREEDWIREQLAASVQPLIVSYEDYRPATLTWINIWSPMDIISGSLEYYDDPAGAPTPGQSVQNIRDPQAWVPLAAHAQYWQNEVLRKQLYRYVSETPAAQRVMGAGV